MALRKGAARISEIPPDVLRDLNAGRIETVTLVESLAIDVRALARSLLPAIDLVADAKRLASEPITRRLTGMGEALRRALDGRPRRLFEAVASHRSDTVRSWAAFAADPDLALEQRLAAARRFAADPHMGVRECAWMSYRPFLAKELARGLKLLQPWVRDRDPNVRRCAVESTRPRGVWTAHLEPIKARPELGLPLLEPVRSDPSRYVQNAVANWLNDASKATPAWVEKVCARWTRESKTAETAYIVRRALRTIRRPR